jgi:prepilin-type N-terminal cleavage/methylation domain-containing protein
MLTVRNRTADRGEAGFTLVELLVVIVLLGVVGGVVVSAITTGLRSASASTARTMALHDIEVALQRVGRDLRAADPLYLTASTDYGTTIGAEFLRDRKIEVVRFSIDVEDGVRYLVQNSQQFDLDDVISGNPTATVLPQRRLVVDIDNDDPEDDPIFVYYDADGILIDCVPGEHGETKQSCDDEYGAAQQIGIRLVRNVPGQEPIRAETRVNVRNTRYGG